jgi:hypothetical protein
LVVALHELIVVFPEFLFLLLLLIDFSLLGILDDVGLLLLDVVAVLEALRDADRLELLPGQFDHGGRGEVLADVLVACIEDAVHLSQVLVGVCLGILS